MFLYYQDKCGRPANPWRETLSPAPGACAPGAVLRPQPPARASLLRGGTACDKDRACRIGSCHHPPPLTVWEAARCTIFGQSNGCPATCRLRAAPPGWMVPRGYHPSRGPSAPAPAHRQSRQAAPGRPGRRPMPLQGGLPPADGRAPPGWSPAGKEGGGEPRRPLSGRAEWAKGWAAPREAARPARSGERPPSWRVFFGRRRSG